LCTDCNPVPGIDGHDGHDDLRDLFLRKEFQSFLVSFIAREITDIGLMLDSSEFEKTSKWLQTIGYKSQPNKRASVFQKGKMTFSLFHGEQNKLWYLQFKNNYSAKKREIKFSNDSKIDIEKEQSTWWFYPKDQCCPNHH